MWKFSRAKKESRETVAASGCLLCKYTQIFCCLFFISIFGFMMIFYWGTKGFLCSVCLIITLLIGLNVSNGFELGNVLFSMSTMLSWLILLLGRQEIALYFKNKTFKEQNLEEKCVFLQKKINQMQELLIFKKELQKNS